ncbi:hypothetical protein [Streptomyces sp. NPDC127098]|uniref:hypothetical protein n=1 Tax=Streptomyces sp. NPDC127098 TaxID=3347137 RepID=UPI00364BC6C8
MELIGELGLGVHHIVVSVIARSPATSALTAVVTARHIAYDPAELTHTHELLAKGMEPAVQAALVARSRVPGCGGREVLRGWKMTDAWLEPLTAEEVRIAYTTNPTTREPLPPEPNVDYHAGLPIPPP